MRRASFLIFVIFSNKCKRFSKKPTRFENKTEELQCKDEKRATLKVIPLPSQFFWIYFQIFWICLKSFGFVFKSFGLFSNLWDLFSNLLVAVPICRKVHICCWNFGNFEIVKKHGAIFEALQIKTKYRDGNPKYLKKTQKIWKGLRIYFIWNFD